MVELISDDDRATAEKLASRIDQTMLAGWPPHIEKAARAILSRRLEVVPAGVDALMDRARAYLDGAQTLDGPFGLISDLLTALDALAAAGSTRQATGAEIAQVGLIAAARNLIAVRFDAYKAGNGRRVSIEGDDGEKCWIVPFEAMAGLEAALSTSLPEDATTSLQKVQTTAGSPGLVALEEALSRYRYAIDWVASDSWDFCSECRDRIRWARQHDPIDRLSNDDMAAMAKKYFAETGAVLSPRKPHEATFILGHTAALIVAGDVPHSDLEARMARELLAAHRRVAEQARLLADAGDALDKASQDLPHSPARKAAYAAATAARERTKAEEKLPGNNPELYSGHGRHRVITQPEPGRFGDRPMTAVEVAAIAPARAMALDIYKYANYAGCCYIWIWDSIVTAFEGKFQSTARLQALEAAVRDIADAAAKETGGTIYTARIKQICADTGCER